MIGSLSYNNSTVNSLIYALQWLFTNLVLCIVLPLIIGPYLGLDQEGLRLLTQRTFLFTGLATMMQVYLGHRMPIYEGLSTIWISAIIALSCNAVQIAKPLSQLRSELALGFIAGGLLYIILGSFKLMRPISRLFTPSVMGTFFVLIVFQISKSIASNFIFFTEGLIVINWLNLTVALITISVICVVNRVGPVRIRNFSLLIGAFIGWVVYLMASLKGFTTYQLISAEGLPVVELPELLAWGKPSFNLVVIITSLIIAFMVFANLIATVRGMANLLKIEDPNIDGAVMMTGVANIIGGFAGVIGFVPMSHCIGFVQVTGNSSSGPLVLHALFLMFMGLIPALGAFFASMPPAVGQAILMVILLKMFNLGLVHYSSINMTSKKKLTIYLPLSVGMIILLMPQHYFNELPIIISGIAGNGFVVGLILAVVLDNLLKEN